MMGAIGSLKVRSSTGKLKEEVSWPGTMETPMKETSTLVWDMEMESSPSRMEPSTKAGWRHDDVMMTSIRVASFTQARPVPFYTLWSHKLVQFKVLIDKRQVLTQCTIGIFVSHSENYTFYTAFCIHRYLWKQSTVMTHSVWSSVTDPLEKLQLWAHRKTINIECPT